jgi:hypothetical protein
VAFKIPYVYDYIIKLSRTQAEVIVIHVIPNVHGIGQGKARHGKYKRLKLGGGQAYKCSADNCIFIVAWVKANLLNKPSLIGNLCIPCINVTCIVQ